jgi:polyribonucleotide nucleotidyltransferase
LGFDDRGKVRLSMKIVDQETGQEIPQEPRPEGEEAQEPRGERRERRPRRD